MWVLVETELTYVYKIVIFSKYCDLLSNFYQREAPISLVNNIILAIQFIKTSSATTLLHVGRKSHIKPKAEFFIENTAIIVPSVTIVTILTMA